MTSLIDDIQLSQDKELKELIRKYKNEEIPEVLFQLSHLPIEKRNFIARQIKGRKKSKEKFPFLLEAENIIYPQGISLEQSSSEYTAVFKSNLFTGNRAVDLTSGFGIDSIFLSKKFNELILNDLNKDLLRTVEHNYKQLGIDNTLYRNESAENILKKISDETDLIYIDPSRRDINRRIFRMEECEPNILQLIAEMRKKSRNILIKLSPMADISDILKKIPELSAIHVVSVDNECKEILVSISEGIDFNGKVKCVELTKNKFEYTFDLQAEYTLEFKPDQVKKYLYVPNVALTKAGAFKSLCRDFHISKLSTNTHLYTSDRLLESFPGKSYASFGVVPYKKNAITKLTNEKNFNIIKRNFPDDVKLIAKKLNIGLSGDLYLFAYRNYKEKPELSLCQILSAEPSAQ